MRRWFCYGAVALLAVGCADNSQGNANMQTDAAAESADNGVAVLPSDPFKVMVLASLTDPWAMTFLPDGRLLVTEQSGRLRIVSAHGAVSQPLAGVPKVAAAGQGGLADVVLHPDFANNGLVYLSFAEPGENGTAGLAVGRGRLVENGIENFQVIWRQTPKVSGNGHFSGKMAFGPDGYLYIGAGDRQKLDPAQDREQTLGKVIRLTDTGEIPSDNPFFDKADAPKSAIWSYGHRNILGLAFDPEGQLWEVEMGPKGGDELNLIKRKANYGWPLVSEGVHYNDDAIPKHDTKPAMIAPQVAWTPVISPSSLIIYTGDMFPQWKGSALVGGLSSKALVRVVFEDGKAREAERFDMKSRIREIEQGPNGAIWVLEDGDSGGRLLRLTAANSPTAS